MNSSVLLKIPHSHPLKIIYSKIFFWDFLVICNFKNSNIVHLVRKSKFRIYKNLKTIISLLKIQRNHLRQHFKWSNWPRFTKSQITVYYVSCTCKRLLTVLSQLIFVCPNGITLKDFNGILWCIVQCQKFYYN